MRDRVLSVHIGLRIRSLGNSLSELKGLVDARAPLQEIMTALEGAESAAAELDRLVPDASILAGNLGLPRHLEWAKRITRERGNQYPDQDVADLAGGDFESVVDKVCKALPETESGARLRAALASLEGPAVEFKQKIPDQARDLVKEFAALASAGGSLFIGVDDSARVVGLDVQTTEDVDKLELRLRGIARQVDPPVSVSTWWSMMGDAVVVEAQVHPSGDPIHYAANVPYVRDGSVSRPARPGEVVRAINEFDRRRQRLLLEPSVSSFIKDDNGDNVAAFAHVRVTNLGNFLFKVRASARFLSSDGIPLHEDLMPLRWSSAPEPLSIVWTPDGLKNFPDQSKIPLSFAVDMAPGDVEDTAVAIKFADSANAWGWTGESYVTNWRHPKWELTAERCVVEVVVRAEGREESARFRLNPNVAVSEFAVERDGTAGGIAGS